MRREVADWSRSVGARKCSSLATLIGLLSLAGCGERAESLSDGPKIVQSVLALLAADQEAICVERTAKGDTLFAYREMLRAPPASRSHLKWYRPDTLKAVEQPTAREIAKAEFSGTSNRIPEARSSGVALSSEGQRRLDDAARTLAGRAAVPDRVRVRESWVPPKVTVKGWAFRDAGCPTPYLLTAPTHDGRLGFITVSVAHHATTYALERQGARWRPIARWNVWMY